MPSQPQSLPVPAAAPPADAAVVRPRPRLERLRAAAETRPLVLVAAPAGYGKSTLVAQWMDVDPRPSAWVRLQPDDNDPLVLLARLTSALARTGPVGRDLLDELPRRPPRIAEALLPGLAGELARRGPLVLVLDDVHVATTTSSQEVLAFLVDHVPDGSQLILIGRGHPPVAVGRLRAAGDLAEVGVEHLALDAQETREVAGRGGLDLSPEQAVGLCTRTEGWAAGVVLAALAFHGREDGAARAAQLSGDQPEVAEYLLEEVLESQPEQLRTFMLGTSVLETMTPALVDAVLGTTGSATSLDALARADAFIVPADDCRETFRYHRLFQDFLRGELARRHPELVSAHLERAADWCEAHGASGDAFVYAYESGDLHRAGRVALAHRDELSRDGHSERITRWLDRCSDEEITSDPQLSLAAAWVLMFRGDLARARKCLAAAARGPLEDAPADGASSLSSAIASVRSLLAPDGIGAMLRDGEFIYEAERRAGTQWLASGCRAIGVARVLQGRPEDGVAMLREALALLSDHPEFAHFRVVVLGYLTFAAAETGERRDVLRWAVEATQVVADHRLDATAGGAIAATAAAIAHQIRGDHVAAAQQLEAVRERRRYVPGIVWIEADLALRCADVSLDLGDASGALAFTQVAGDKLQGYPDPGALPLRLERVEQRIRQGQAYGLTSAELRILSFLPTHLSLQEIADQLFLARSTVKTHVARIYDKLGVPGRSEAVELIEAMGLGSVNTRIAVQAAGPGHASADGPLD